MNGEGPKIKRGRKRKVVLTGDQMIDFAKSMAALGSPGSSSRDAVKFP
jgi:hypothetical protein